MSQSKYATWDDREIGTVERAVAEHLADEARRGPVFIQSSRIAEDLEDNLSPQRVGQAMATLRNDWPTLSIERWSASTNSTATWHVEHDGPSPFGVECSDCGTLVDDVGDECPSCGTEVGR